MILCLKMIPTSSIAVPIYEIICNMGLYDTRIALIIVYAAVNMPFVMWTMLSFYEGVPSTLDEAAYVDPTMASYRIPCDRCLRSMCMALAVTWK